MEKVNIKCDFSTSAISDIRDINSSFARARLKVMYLGANRNRTFFSRDAVQRALPSLRNVPVVCNWNYEEGTIGGHDMDVVTDSEGRMRLMNMTDPCGVVPDHAKFSFVTEVDESGVGHEYLVVDDIILWKRQDVFNHIRNDLDGKVDHSMEVNIFDKGVNPEGLIDISNFEFKHAIVDYFRNHSKVLIVTDAGSEGLNLQFCNTVINYDLPWNPQKIEQRIGRCHRYGQKNDVVAINLLNTENKADRRVYDILSKKFELFDGVFGASDVALGVLESGASFEKTILEIYYFFIAVLILNTWI